jgi:GxxExxY protein
LYKKTKMEEYRKEEYFKIVGICMEIHRILGGGLLEIVYKDALEYEFKKHNIPFQREKEYSIKYKDIVLAHKFYADFVIYDEIILEVKASKDIIDEYTAQTINYLRLADSDLGIIVNFNKKSLQHKRVIH